MVPKFDDDPNTKGADISVNNGIVQPGTVGMSASPTPVDLPDHRRPPEYGGKGKDPVFRIDIRKLGPGLRFVPDKPGHGTVQPSSQTGYDNYNAALEATRNSWELVPSKK